MYYVNSLIKLSKISCEEYAQKLILSGLWACMVD